MTCKDCIHNGVCWKQEELLSTHEWDEEQECCQDASRFIELPCKVGDDIYWIDSETEKIIREKGAIKAVCYFGEGKFEVIVEGDSEPEAIGTKWCMLTREEAEEALAKHKEG